jgi:hypothetical protein
MSTCGDSVSVTNSSVNSSIKNENSGPGFNTNSTDLRDLILPEITDGANQIQIYFIQEVDQYFSLKKMPSELRLPLVFWLVK